jgi:predicted phage replisome organizer
MKGRGYGMAKKYYWLKLPYNWFNNKRIKKLRSIAGGDTYTIIYLKMQLLSLENEGKLYFDGVEDDFVSELALELDEDVENVKLTVSFLQKNGLLEVNSAEEYLLTEVPEAIGSESGSTERVRQCRQRQKQLLEKSEALHCNSDVTPCNSSVTTCNTEIDIEIEKEIENITVSGDTVRQTDVQRVIDAWNSLGLAQIHKITGDSKRGQMLRARIREYGADEVIKAIHNVSASTFLRGGSKSGWIITFDWFVKPNNFPKVLEGNYADPSKQEPDSKYGDILKKLINEDRGDLVE